MPAPRLRRDRHRRRPQRPGVRRVPRPRRACARCWSRHAPPSAAPRRASRSPARTVNICNCDHITFRTTPVMEELGLAEHGLRYLDVDPAQTNLTWSGGTGLGHPPRRRADARLDRPHLPRRGRRLPALPEGGDAGGADGVRRGERPAVAVGGLTRKVLARRGRRRQHPAALESPQRRRRDARVLHHRRAAGPGDGDRPDGVGHLARAARHRARRAHLRAATRGHGRPAGRRQRHGAGDACERSFDAPSVAWCARPPRSRPSRARARPSAASRSTTAPRSRPPIVVSACNPHDTFLALAHATRRRRHTRSCERWRATPHDDGYESKIDAVVATLPRLRGMHEACPTTPHPLTAPSSSPRRSPRCTAGTRLMARRRGARPTGHVRSTSRPCSTRRMAPAGRHVLSLECLVHAVRSAGRLADSAEPRRWLDQFATLAATRLPRQHSATGGR